MKNLLRGCAVVLCVSSLVAFAEDKKPEAAKAAAPEAKKEAPAAAKKDAPPPPPPELKKTVDAMIGTWTMEGTVTGMAKDPIKVKETYVCKKAAGGRAVSCTGKGNVPGMGVMESEALVTYDAEGKNVRFVGMDSMGEVHDHICQWKDDKNLACDPLNITAMGQPATVDFNMTWSDAKNMSMAETTTMKDGTKVAYEGKGKR